MIRVRAFSYWPFCFCLGPRVHGELRSQSCSSAQNPAIACPRQSQGPRRGPWPSSLLAFLCLFLYVSAQTPSPWRPPLSTLWKREPRPARPALTNAPQGRCSRLLALLLYREQHLTPIRCPESVGRVNSPAPPHTQPKITPASGASCPGSPAGASQHLLQAESCSQTPPPRRAQHQPPDRTPHTELLICSCSQGASLSNMIAGL